MRHVIVLVNNYGIISNNHGENGKDSGFSMSSMVKVV